MAIFEVRATQGPIPVNEIQAMVSQPENGAQLLFLGVVRNHNFGRRVVAVEYDMHTPLAERMMGQICNEAKSKWGSDLAVIVVHRAGKLEVGEVSVVVAVGAPHREEAYQASRYIIDQIKHRVPIWKKEHYEDGETEWLDGHALCTPFPQNGSSGDARSCSGDSARHRRGGGSEGCDG